MKTRIQQKKESQSGRNKAPDGPEKTSAPLKSIQHDSTQQQKNAEKVKNNPVMEIQQQKLNKIFNASNQEQVSQYALNPEDEELMVQGKFIGETVVQQKSPEEDEELMAQGKFKKDAVVQQMPLEEEELPGQGKFLDNKLIQRQPMEDDEELHQSKANETAQMNKTGIPDEVKNKMENSLNSDFSNVKVHANSSKAPEVGALAYTQGHDIHFAPGQFNPESSQGQKLLGHELTHVVQQRQGRVKPTTEIGGMPVNDNPSLEKEADDLGSKASK